MKKIYLFILVLATALSSALAQAPQFTPAGTPDDEAHWYYLEFETSEGLKVLKADGGKALFEELSIENGKHWKLEGTADEFFLISKTGRYLSFAATSSPYFSLGSSSTGKYKSKLIEDPAKPGYYQIQAVYNPANSKNKKAGLTASSPLTAATGTTMRPVKNSKGDWKPRSKTMNQAENYFRFVPSTQKFPTAIKTVEGASVKLFPNPATNYIQLSGFVANAEVHLFALTGELVLKAKTSAQGTAKLNVADLARGAYVLRSGKTVVKLQLR